MFLFSYNIYIFVKATAWFDWCWLRCTLLCKFFTRIEHCIINRFAGLEVCSVKKYGLFLLPGNHSLFLYNNNNNNNNNNLIPKSEDSKEVRNYRPITCLTTMYKTLTGIIAKRISTHLEEQSLLQAEQKGCHPGSKGCKDQLMISKAIYEDCRRRNKNLSIAWIDYQKPFIAFHIVGWKSQ